MTASKPMWPAAGPVSRYLGIGAEVDDGREIQQDRYGVGPAPEDEELESKSQHDQQVEAAKAYYGIRDTRTIIQRYARFEAFAAPNWNVSPSTLFKVSHYDAMGRDTFLEMDGDIRRVRSDVLIEVTL